MKYLRYSYSDPTGAGEDATLTLPVWALPPRSINARDGEGLFYGFDLEDEAGEEVE